jgi:hypothetical protein
VTLPAKFVRGCKIDFSTIHETQQVRRIWIMTIQARLIFFKMILQYYLRMELQLFFVGGGLSICVAAGAGEIFR